MSFDFERRARAMLDLAWPREDPGRASDMDLNPDWRERLDDVAYKPAAVMVPVTAGEDAARVVLTRRSEHLPSHAGQVAFPGGKLEEGDRTPLDAALREAEEEIGLNAGSVTPLGYLDPYYTGTGFKVQPVVTLVPADYTYMPDENEVAAVFDVPLDFLMDPANHAVHALEWRGAPRRYYAMPYGEHYIWGATAGIIRRLYERLYKA